MGFGDEWQRRRPPTRQFPRDPEPHGVVPEPARVDLIYERSRLLRGSVGGRPVRLDLNVPASDGRAEGVFAGVPASAIWTNSDNYQIYPDVPSELTGSFAGEQAELHALFHLEPGYFLDHGTITGRVGDEQLDAAVEAASGGLGSTRTVVVDGALSSTEFEVYAAVDGSLSSARIRGTVAGNPIRIDATRTRPPQLDQTRLTGRYEGPIALLALAAGALLHFM